MARFWIAFAAAATAAILSTAAPAFQEQNGADAPPAQVQSAPAAGVTEAPSVKPSAGTEVRIPGLGSLGVLPKMDFGLELLYGAAGDKPEAETPSSLESPPDDLTIRGSLKHNF